MPTISEVLTAAKEASIAKSLAVWEVNGKKDMGSCGGVCMYLKSNTKLAKEAVAMGIARKSGAETIVNQMIGEGIMSQNEAIPQSAMAAFKAVLIANGFEKAISKYWTYVD